MQITRRNNPLATLSLVLGLAGCSPPPAATSVAPAAPAASTAPAAELPPPNPDNNVYFGDVHVHTGWSFDAFTSPK